MRGKCQNESGGKRDTSGSKTSEKEEHSTLPEDNVAGAWQKHIQTDETRKQVLSFLCTRKSTIIRVMPSDVRSRPCDLQGSKAWWDREIGLDHPDRRTGSEG